MCFNEDQRYQFTLANNFYFPELISVARGRRQISILLGGRYRQVSLYRPSPEYPRWCRHMETLPTLGMLNDTDPLADRINWQFT